MGFQTPQYKLAKLLEWAGDGTIQLPDFQRGYKWEEERIRSLLVTVCLGHPLGVIMLLETGSDQVRFKPKPIEGAPPATAAVSPDKLLLDGQQRLTSLYQAMAGTGVVATKDGRNMLTERRYYLDIAKAIEGPESRDDAVTSVPRDGVVRTNFNRDIVLDVSTPEKERVAGLFPLRLVYDQGEAMSWLFEYEDVAQRKAFLTDVLQPMLSYELPAIELDKSTTKAAVATVFEKVNTGGLSLNVFELLTATFAGDAAYYAGHGTDFRLNDHWQETEALLAKHPVLAGFANTDFLAGVTLLASQRRNQASKTDRRPPQITARKEDIFKLRLEEFLQWAQPLRDGLEWAAAFLSDQHIHAANYVPYRTQIVPLAVFRVIMGTEADLHGVRQRLAQWFWCGVLGELYAGATETRFARDVEQVPPWALGAVNVGRMPPVPATIMDAAFQESRLLSLRTRNSAAYKGIYALLMASGAKDWKQDKKFDHTQYSALKVDVHHIFPRAWCAKNDVDRDQQESIVNKTPLGSSTNQSIGGASPAQYLPRIERAAGISQEQLDAILSTHAIDPVSLRMADFEPFFDRRRAALLDLVEAAMGKAAQRDVETPDELVEAPAAFEPEPDDLDDVTDAQPATSEA